MADVKQKRTDTLDIQRPTLERGKNVQQKAGTYNQPFETGNFSRDSARFRAATVKRTRCSSGPFRPE